MLRLTLFLCLLSGLVSASDTPLNSFSSDFFKETLSSVDCIQTLEEQITFAEQGKIVYTSGEMYKLCDLTFEAVVAAQERDDRISMAALWILIARSLELEKDFTTAITAYQEAAWLYRNLRDKHKELGCTLKVMNIYHNKLENLNATLLVVDQILAQKNYLIENQLHDQLLSSYCTKGAIYAQKSSVDSNEYYLAKAIAFNEQYSTKNYALAYIPYIKNMLDRQDYYNAIYHCEQFTLKAQKEENMIYEMWSWSLRARLYTELGIYKKAETAFEQAALLAGQQKEAKQFELKKMITKYLQYQQDTAFLSQIEVLTQKLIASNSCFDDPSILIDLYTNNRSFEIATMLTDQYIDCAKSNNNIFQEGKAKAKKITLLFRMGKYEQAAANIESTYRLVQQIQSPLLLSDLETILGQLAASRGASEQASIYFQRAKTNRNKIETLKLQNVELLTKRLAEQEKQLAIVSKERELLRVKQERTSMANLLISLALISLFIVLILWKSRRRVLISNQQIKYELNENIYLLAKELNTNKLQLSEATQQAISDQEDTLSAWTKEVIQLSKTDSNPLLLGRQLGRLQNVLKTRLQQQKEMVANVRQLAAQKEEELKSFNYMIGHDLKMPLSTANNLVHLLLSNQERLDTKTLEYIQEFEKSLHEMNSMINGINRYAKVDHLPLLEKEIELAQLLQFLIDKTKNTSPEARAIDFEISNPLPIVKGDRMLIRQVLTNVMSNAVKFSTPVRMPIIKIFSETVEDYNILVIQDNGVGIPKEKQKKVFELFQSAHSREKFEGTGIGLTIVQRIMQRHGGKVKVKSKVGVGTAISLFFPKL
ncbi:MAG: ATP-binding protein [Bacteroidota bacterium]